MPYDNASRLIVLRLGGGAVRVADRLPSPPPPTAGMGPQPTSLVGRGAGLYRANCGRCHGLVGERTPFPDLRRMRPETVQAFDEIVLGGAYKDAGMASFADVLRPSDTRAIRAYLADWAARDARPASPPASKGARRAGGPPVSLPTT
jgi:mono/diheme cytochrome c family protein